MPMPIEIAATRTLKAAMIVGAAYMALSLVTFSTTMECPLGAYSPSVLYAALASIIILFAYIKTNFLSNGIFSGRLSYVRAFSLGLLLIEIAWMTLLTAHNSGCTRFLNAAALPFGLLIFYSGFILALLFGDAYLGVLRSIIRLGDNPRKAEP